MTRGRTLFALFRPVLRGGSAALRVLPRPICATALALLRHVPTSLGVAIRYMLLARLAKSCGDNVAVFEGVHLFRIEKMSIGHNVSIHPMCYLSGEGGVSIGNDVSIAHATTIMSTEHDFSDPAAPIRDAPVIRAEVTIEDDVWIAAGVRILAGVHVGRHSVIGAGAVVVKDVPECSLAVGVPARVIRKTRVEGFEAHGTCSSV